MRDKGDGCKMNKNMRTVMALLLLVITCTVNACGNAAGIETAVESQTETIVLQSENVEIMESTSETVAESSDVEESNSEEISESTTESTEEDTADLADKEDTDKDKKNNISDAAKKDAESTNKKEVTDANIASGDKNAIAAANEAPVAENIQPVVTPAITPENPQQAVAPAPVPVAAANIVIIGDSRCVQMRDSTGGGGCVWICDNGKRYEWFAENAVPRADAVVGKGTKVVICMGVNDPGDASQYAALVNVMAAQWAARGAKTYYVSVNPVWENPYITEEQVVNFNASILSQLIGVRWIDTHSYLMNAGYYLVDGLHYDNETNLKIFGAIIGSL